MVGIVTNESMSTDKKGAGILIRKIYKKRKRSTTEKENAAQLPVNSNNNNNNNNSADIKYPKPGDICLVCVCGYAVLRFGSYLYPLLTINFCCPSF
jgi:hypothetical protein